MRPPCVDAEGQICVVDLGAARLAFGIDAQPFPLNRARAARSAPSFW
ncbi:hypothetical protein [Sorangium sp. So ce124]